MSRTIDQLVNQQVLRWLEEQRSAPGGPDQARTPDVQGPMICISREFGALGGEMGERVAAQLAFGFYAQELVHEIAKQARVRQQVVESLDERLQSRVEEWVGAMMEGGRFATSDYLRNLSRVVLTLGRHGRGVIIGRGAQFILEPARTLRVRCYGPLDARVSYIAEREHLSPTEARAKVLRVDAERIAFYRQHFNADVADPAHYDMLINTGSVSLDSAAELVVHAFRAKLG